MISGLLIRGNWVVISEKCLTFIQTIVLIKRMNNNNHDTKHLLLDAAESLFAHHGFHATSLRAITGKAGANLASVNYHFGSKEALLEAVIERRLTPLNNTRIERIDSVVRSARAENSRPPVREVMRAFIEPTLSFRDSEPGAKDFVSLVGRAAAESDEMVRNVFLGFMKPVISLMLEALASSLPDLPRDALVRRFHFTIGSLVHTMHFCDNVPLPPELRFSCLGDTAAVCDELVDFVTLGMEGG